MKRFRLVNERNKRELTQAKVAKDVGISTVYLRKLEAGTENPGRDTMIALSVYYNVPAEELFPDLFCAFYDRNSIIKREMNV